MTIGGTSERLIGFGMPPIPDEYDSPWKEAIEVYLRSIFSFCFPAYEGRILWGAGFEFLDKELQESRATQRWGHNG